LNVVEPTAEEFFASAAGVCVYVNAGGRAFRVQFDSLDGAGLVQGMINDSAVEALAVATTARDRYKSQLAPLFLRVAQELASRAGD
jgi:hypothetical protein